MRTLVIGGTGFLGVPISRALLKDNTEVVLASRGVATDLPANVLAVQLDRSRPDDVSEAIRTHRIDRVVDVIAYDVERTRPLLECLDGKIDRYVLVSSGDVYRNYGLFQKREAGEPVLIPLDETAPLRESRYPYRGDTPRSENDPLKWMDTYDKIPIEEAVSRLKTAWSILRLPMVYGPGDKQHRFRWAIAPMAAEREHLTIASDWANWTTTYGYVENVAAAIATATRHPDAANKTFNIGEETPVSHAEWATRFAQAMNWSGEIVIKDLSAKGALAGLDLSVPFNISSSTFCNATGFSDPCALDHALRTTIASELALN